MYFVLACTTSLSDALDVISGLAIHNTSEKENRTKLMKRQKGPLINPSAMVIGASKMTA
jgi:hypothetical protein